MPADMMTHHILVLPEFMNEHGILFGGYLLKWIDEFAYITACLDYPHNRFVTVSLDNVEFRKPIKTGDILCFEVREVRLGNSSVKYSVTVFNDREKRADRNVLFETNIVFVNVDQNGQKHTIRRE
ncbi:MAG: acyl-CoA thioesterase [Candidatus Omnitrophota bacterium]